MEELSGVIVDSLFYGEDSGFGVIKIEPDGGGRIVTASGIVGEVDVGEHIDVQGRWVDHPRFGRQVKIDKIEISLPHTSGGILRYLSSGAIPGVGPALAGRIIKAFGTETLNILDTDIERLREVNGLGRKKCDKIIEFWKRRDSARKLILFLGEHGIGLKIGLKIQKNYGDAALKTLKDNPYILIKDINGVGFTTADRIALRLGIDPDSPERLKSCLLHQLSRSQDDGHCYLPEKKIVEAVVEQIRQPIEKVEQHLREMIYKGELKSFEKGVQIPMMDFLEKEISTEIKRRSRLAPLIPMDIHVLRSCMKKFVELAPEQLESLELILGSGLSILTGGPGVGKTTLVKVMVAYLEKRGFVPTLAAPTGRAAQRMEEATGRQSQTLHRLMKYRPGAGFAHNRDYPLKGSVFIVDEFSMVDIHLFHALLEALPSRAQLILVGDKDQLPSVGPGKLLGDLISSKQVTTAFLKTVFRQSKGSLLVSNSHKILKREMPEELRGDSLSDFYFIQANGSEGVLSAFNKLIEERIPKRFGKDAAKKVQVLSPMKRGPLGTLALNERLQKLLNPSGRPIFEDGEFCTGDRVLQLSNNYDADLFNGDMGTVVGREKEGMRVLFGKREIIYPTDSLKDLSLAYACTVHKSQGSEYPFVMMPIYSGHRIMLSLELLYTALTRAKKMCIWVGEREFLEKVLSHPVAVSRYTRIAELIRGKEIS